MSSPCSRRTAPPVDQPAIQQMPNKAHQRCSACRLSAQHVLAGSTTRPQRVSDGQTRFRWPTGSDAHDRDATHDPIEWIVPPYPPDRFSDPLLCVLYSVLSVVLCRRLDGLTKEWSVATRRRHPESVRCQRLSPQLPNERFSASAFELKAARTVGRGTSDFHLATTKSEGVIAVSKPAGLLASRSATTRSATPCRQSAAGGPSQHRAYRSQHRQEPRCALHLVGT